MISHLSRCFARGRMNIRMSVSSAERFVETLTILRFYVKCNHLAPVVHTLMSDDEIATAKIMDIRFYFVPYP